MGVPQGQALYHPQKVHEQVVVLGRPCCWELPSICFIGKEAIAKVLTTEEFTQEVKNPESDIHFLFDDLSKLHVEEKQ